MAPSDTSDSPNITWHPDPKTPDFKVSTEYYQVENGNEYRLGDTEEYYYDTVAEKKSP